MTAGKPIRIVEQYHIFEQLQHSAYKELVSFNIKGAADFTQLCEIGRSFYIVGHRPRCRSPPHLKSRLTSMISE